LGHLDREPILGSGVEAEFFCCEFFSGFVDGKGFGGGEPFAVDLEQRANGEAIAGERSNGKLGAVGFCFGGYIVNMLAAVIPGTLDAGVPFYGTPAARELRKNITAPLLIHLGGLDERVNASWPEYEEDLKAIEADYTMHKYPDANHGFHNDSTGRYDKEQADLAWSRTIAFFEKHLH
jgi:carboxymethylenebutenolidase